MKVVSLFCGIGGLDKGFIDTGYDVVWANDFDQYAVQTYKANYSHPVILDDINHIPLESIPSHDILIGGFPCQPFSMMGGQRGFEDARGTLFFRIAEIIKYQIENNRKPRAIILENVRTLRTHDKGNTFSVIKRILENDLGYKVFDMVLNSADYGVPQTRNRLYMVCFANENINEFLPPETQKTNLILRDVLEHDVNEKYYLSDKIRPTILSNGSGGYIAKSEINKDIARPLCATMAKMHRACQDNYVSDRYIFQDNSLDENRIRRLTPRECARLQGFDSYNTSNFIIPVSDSQAYKQFGNAVTVNVSRAVAKQVREKLEELGEWKD